MLFHGCAVIRALNHNGHVTQWMVEHSGALGEGGGVWTTEMGKKNESGMVLAFHESGSANGVGM